MSSQVMEIQPRVCVCVCVCFTWTISVKVCQCKIYSPLALIVFSQIAGSISHTLLPPAVPEGNQRETAALHAQFPSLRSDPRTTGEY